ncbi:efflux RND transporter permease subunit [Aminobacterium sp. MB27-C1]|jgi:HAE1 family hydrophobic/amphiphilic exporter-1|uniref:efflux RND transporter permease subunit n=1 Tax=Aminobacterium sp. MB27-C1 TaxID=3070661 RepID=UPI0027DDFC50|nr:efflux RND transporter permease subunit [Aminobacterium sp. MB27-C1]WMI72311.1 efflux RND transporter permease subunit [Aminobacterium sp. MB27-C1]
MKITDFSLRRPVTVLIGTFALIFFGLLAMKNMGMERVPDVDFPLVAVSTTMQGASPTVMDNDVTDVLEEQLNTISGIENIRSNTYEGRSIILVEFELGRDIDAAAADVRDKVNLAVSDLPEEAETPIVQKFNAGDSPIITLGITGAASYKEQSHFADKVVKERLQTIDGVGSVDTIGLREREIRVWLDPALLESRNLTVKDVKDAIKDKHVELPAGRLESDRRELSIRLEGEYGSVEELEQLPIVSRHGAVIRLRDVARVEDGYEDVRSIATYNGKPVILLEILKQRGANEVALADGVYKELDSLKKLAPSDVNIEVLSDTSSFVRKSMAGVGSDTLIGIGLCSLIMLFFLRTMRATFVTIVTIPVCLLGSLIILKGLGVTINNLSMMGLSLAVGMVVDATTVVLENIHRHLENGKLPMEAASQGTSEVGFAVLAGAATTICVFAPVASMGGVIGRFFYAFGITVVLTIAISLVLSLTLTPFLCSRILRKDRPGKVALKIEAFLEWLENTYRKWLGRCLRHRFIVLAGAVGIFALGIFMAGLLGTGFFPNEDRGDFAIRFELPAGASLDEGKRFLDEIGESVRLYPEVAYTYGTIGSGMGQEVNKGKLNVTLVPRNKRASSTEVMGKMRKQFSTYKDVQLTFGTWGSDISITLVGQDTEQLDAVAQKMKKDIEKDGRLTDVSTDVRLDSPRINVEINRGLADELDVNVRDLSQEIQAYFGGVKSGVMKDGGYRYDIRLRAEEEYRRNIQDIQNIAFKDGNGNLIKAPGLVKVKEGQGPTLVKRYNRQRSLTITANATGISSGEGVTLVMDSFKKYAPSDGSVRVIPTGVSKHMKENFQELFKALAIAIILVYMVMAVQFESFIYPLMVMFSLPLATTGVFGILLVTGMDLDMMSFMGIILLVGIVVNNAIILVDFANQRRAAGYGRLEAMQEAGPLRLRPILMTALSTSIAAIPIALGLSEGGEIRQPMSTAVIGGMLTSTFLTLFVIPAVYVILGDAKEKIAQIIVRLTKKSTVTSMSGGEK